MLGEAVGDCPNASQLLMHLILCYRFDRHCNRVFHSTWFEVRVLVYLHSLEMTIHFSHEMVSLMWLLQVGFAEVSSHNRFRTELFFQKAEYTFQTLCGGLSTVNFNLATNRF